MGRPCVYIACTYYRTGSSSYPGERVAENSRGAETDAPDGSQQDQPGNRHNRQQQATPTGEQVLNRSRYACCCRALLMPNTSLKCRN